MDVTVAIATYGDESWRELARSRPVARCEALGLRYVHVHGDTLHEARNAALDLVETPWVVHVDGDDELAPGFVEAMAQGSADVRAPAVVYVNPGGASSTPKVPKVSGHRHDACTADCLADGNWLVVGAVARTDLLRTVRWRDEALYEDWSMWVRCWQAGATFEAIPTAVYRAYARRNSRNRAPDPRERFAAHVRIAIDLGLPVPS